MIERRVETSVERKERKGFTLMELVIVLCVIGLVLAVIWVAASAVWSNYKVYRVNQQVIAVIKNVRDVYGASGKLMANGVVTPALHAEGILPNDMASGASYAHALGGAFVMEKQAGSFNVRLRLQNVSRAHCMKTLMSFPVLVPEYGIKLIGTSDANSANINLNNVANPGGGVALPVTSATAGAWCASPNNNEVRLDVSIRN